MTTHDVLALLGRGTLTMSGAICLVLALRLPTRRWLGAQATYLLWLLLPAMLLVNALPAAQIPIATLPSINVSTARAAMAWTMPTHMLDANIQVWLFTLWLCGAIAAIAVLLRQQYRFTRRLGTLQQRADGWRSEFDGIGPALVGALRPRIVLPADFDAQYSERERTLVVAHERVHLRRGDAQINALVALLRCLQWFNPLIHFAASRFRFDQEIACDAAVMTRFPEARRCYADAMLRAQLTGQARQELRLPVGCYWQSDHPLKERIMLLKKPVPAFARRLGASACIAVLIGAVSFASWAAQSGQDLPAQAGKIMLGELKTIESSSDGALSENITFRRMKAPIYPADAVKAGVGAKVVVKAQVDEYGRAQSAEIVKLDLTGEPKPAKDGTIPDRRAFADAFAQTSIAAVKSWTYNPGTKDGKPVAGYGLIPIDFSLYDCDKDHPCDPQKAQKQG